MWSMSWVNVELARVMGAVGVFGCVWVDRALFRAFGASRGEYAFVRGRKDNAIVRSKGNIVFGGVREERRGVRL